MRHAVLFAAVAFGASALAAPRPKDSSPTPDFFPTAVGSRWVYSTPTGEEVEVISAVARTDLGVLVTVMHEEEGERTGPVRKFEVRADGLFVAAEDGNTYEPPICRLKLPARVGETWDTKTTHPNLGQLRFPHHCIESGEVITPAGTFRAVRVQGETIYENGAQSQPWVDWYAPGVGPVKHNDWVLKSFTPGRR